MWILGIDSTGPAASCALLENGVLRGESYLNIGATHSEALLPMVLELLNRCHIDVAALGGIAVTAGPGSFTGLRIGLATAKGLAFAQGTPCCGISTLEAMAALCPPGECALCPVMDARRDQVYNALFCRDGGALRRLTGDRALPVEQLGCELAQQDRPVWLTGDGAELCAAAFERIPGFRFTVAPEHQRQQRALGAALLYRAQCAASADGLQPQYLRLPQAERERLEREQGVRHETAFRAEAKDMEV